MKKMLLVIAISLSLGACADLQNLFGLVTGTTVTPDQAYIAANSFDVVEQTATTYLSLPACTTGGTVVCRSAAATAAIVPAIRSARIARNNLEAAINANANGGAPIPATVEQVLTAAVNTLQGIITEYGITAQ